MRPETIQKPAARSAVALPARVRSEVQRILDGAARRLLDEQIDGDAIGAAPTGRDGCSLDGRADQRAFLIEGEPLPIGARVDAQRDAHAA